MNGLGYSLTILWLTRSILRRRLNLSLLPSAGRPKNHGRRFADFALAFSTMALLAYCLISTLNARATYLPEQSRFEFFPCINWLPHSFDRRRTCLAFWNYLALAGAFWAIRDWLRGRSTAEEFAQRKRIHWYPGIEPGLLPERLRRLVWVLSINGALLAIEGIVQRLANSPRLLFLVKPHIHQAASSQFGAFAYRANAAEYFNLAWPVCLGFWLALSARPDRKRNGNAWLLGSAWVMAACPIISTSRGGALVSVGLFVLIGLTIAFFTLLSTETRLSLGFNPGRTTALAVFYMGAPALGLAVGWSQLQPRLESIGEGLNGRERIYQTASSIAAQFPLYGTGPGTYETISALYRPSGPDFWPAQVHNDWLETRITFGWVGSALIGAAFSTLLVSGFMRGGLVVNTQFVVLTWLALIGCLIHARFDFPFQVYSILFLFLVLCAVISVLSTGPNSCKA